jgi:ankyrin repeat protein
MIQMKYLLLLCFLLTIQFSWAQPTELQEKIKQKELQTEFFEAVLEGKMELVKKMLADGFDLKTTDNYGRIALHESAIFGKNEVTKLLIERGSAVNTKDKSGNTPLHLAANMRSPFDEGNIKSIRLLIANGADALAKNNEGFNPLEYAIHSEHTEALQLLVDKGCPVNKKYEDGKTLLHQTAWGGRITATQILIAAGANLYAKDNDGKTPLDVATYHTVVDMLKEAMGKE